MFAHGPREHCGENSLIMQNQSRIESTNKSPAEEQREKAIASFSPTRSAHRIGILMSQTGRFLECITCRLSFVFPPGSRYETIAKQFESHLCQSAIARASESSQSPGPELDLQD